MYVLDTFEINFSNVQQSKVWPFVKDYISQPYSRSPTKIDLEIVQLSLFQSYVRYVRGIEKH